MGPGAISKVAFWQHLNRKEKDDFAVRKAIFIGADHGSSEASEVGAPVPELIRRSGISEKTFYLWEKISVGLEVDDLRRKVRDEDEVTHGLDGSLEHR